MFCESSRKVSVFPFSWWLLLCCTACSLDRRRLFFYVIIRSRFPVKGPTKKVSWCGYCILLFSPTCTCRPLPSCVYLGDVSPPVSFFRWFAAVFARRVDNAMIQAWIACWGKYTELRRLGARQECRAGLKPRMRCSSSASVGYRRTHVPKFCAKEGASLQCQCSLCRASLRLILGC